MSDLGNNTLLFQLVEGRSLHDSWPLTGLTISFVAANGQEVPAELEHGDSYDFIIAHMISELTAGWWVMEGVYLEEHDPPAIDESGYEFEWQWHMDSIRPATPDDMDLRAWASHKSFPWLPVDHSEAALERDSIAHWHEFQAAKQDNLAARQRGKGNHEIADAAWTVAAFHRRSADSIRRGAGSAK